MTEKDLCTIALQAMQYAYAPYSGYLVGAALLTADGKIYTGCNIENAAYSPTICAERVALFKAVSEGQRDFVALAVAGGKDGVVSGAFPPCGVCRQALAEFCPSTMPVLVVERENSHRRYTLADLLPEAFGPTHLTKDE